MSTRSTTHFVEGGRTPRAIIYRHSDGYPEGHGRDLLTFFADVKAQTSDTRFNDATYLASKLVVWLAGRFASPGRPLAFLSVGVTMEDPGDIEYRYVIDCSRLDTEGFPVVTIQELDGSVIGELREVLKREVEATV